MSTEIQPVENTEDQLKGEKEDQPDKEEEDQFQGDDEGDENNQSEEQNQYENTEGEYTTDDEDERYNEQTESRESGRSRQRTSEKNYCPGEKLAKIIEKKAALRSNRPDDPTNPLRHQEYIRHRERVKTARSMVDSSSPIASKLQYTSKSYNRRLLNFARIERENTIMLQHLANIIHGKGSLDNKWERSINSVNNRGQSRQLKMLHITFDNLTLLKRIQAIKPFYSRREQLVEYKRNEEVMTQLSMYPLFWHLKDVCKWGRYEGKARANAENRPRARCFLDIGNQSESYGRIIIDLYASLCPFTAENFRALCTGENGPSYKCSTIHRVIPDLLWQGGEITSGSKSIYGESFPDENFKLKHDAVGTVSMANCGPNSNASQFIIAAKPLTVLDGSNVVFGKVVEGMGVLKSLYNKVAASGRPKKKVWIIDCGELDPDSDISEYQDNEEEEDEDEEEEDDDEEYENAMSEPTTILTEEEYSDGAAVETDTGNSGQGQVTADDE